LITGLNELYSWLYIVDACENNKIPAVDSKTLLTCLDLFQMDLLAWKEFRNIMHMPEL
jgi:hypothetical protein